MRFSLLPTIFVLACAQLHSVLGSAASLEKRVAAHSSQLITFTAAEDLNANLAGLTGGLGDLLNKGPAKVGVYFGVDIEDPHTGFLFLDGVGASISNSLLQSVIKTVVGNVGVTVQHIKFPANTALPAIFTAGETEITRVALKTGTTVAQVTPLLTQLTTGIRNAEGGVDAVFGTNIGENAGTLELVAGWESVEAHSAAIAEPALLDVIIQLLGLVDIVPVNVVFHKLL